MVSRKVIRKLEQAKQHANQIYSSESVKSLSSHLLKSSAAKCELRYDLLLADTRIVCFLFCEAGLSIATETRGLYVAISFVY